MTADELKIRSLKEMVSRVRHARLFPHVSHPTTMRGVRSFHGSARDFIKRYGDDLELANFHEAWSDAFVTPPNKGRITKAWVEAGDDLKDGVPICHPDLGRRALSILIAVARRVARGQPSSEESDNETADVFVIEAPSYRPHQRPGSARKRRPGPKPDTENYRKVAEIARGYGDDWRNPDTLGRICEHLDRQNVPVPKHWHQWDQGERSWLQKFHKKARLVIQAIEYRIAKTQEP